MVTCLGGFHVVCGWQLPSYPELAFVLFVGPKEAPFDALAQSRLPHQFTSQCVLAGACCLWLVVAELSRAGFCFVCQPQAGSF